MANWFPVEKEDPKSFEGFCKGAVGIAVADGDFDRALQELENANVSAMYLRGNRKTIFTNLPEPDDENRGKDMAEAILSVLTSAGIETRLLPRARGDEPEIEKETGITWYMVAATGDFREEYYRLEIGVPDGDGAIEYAVSSIVQTLDSSLNVTRHAVETRNYGTDLFGAMLMLAKGDTSKAGYLKHSPWMRKQIQLAIKAARKR